MGGISNPRLILESIKRPSVMNHIELCSDVSFLRDGTGPAISSRLTTMLSIRSLIVGTANSKREHSNNFIQDSYILYAKRERDVVSSYKAI